MYYTAEKFDAEFTNENSWFDDLVDNVLEVYYNETQDYEVIAERFNITLVNVASIINDFVDRDIDNV